MFYEVSKEVFDKLPDFVVGVVAVTGIDNSKEVPAITKMLEENAEAVRKYFEESGNKAKNDPCVVPYREAFRALGINPNRYACAAEALMDRIAKGKGMPEINPAVDLGNAMSLKYKLPIGALRIPDSRSDRRQPKTPSDHSERQRMNSTIRTLVRSYTYQATRSGHAAGPGDRARSAR